ncbi:hypothetical protein QBC46DRAFT_414532 [Diplogelasinospora grovesii]|uniref:DEK-C domain-containing protein n=1 Tax=Diplogelasinospora grovesii TaxID=303347 RepID=A0AAN6MVQ3_9PEZI|nr:hypothetical protein QBC46DRAFT_414532 [Diplogelasinospora grovesii]
METSDPAVDRVGQVMDKPTNSLTMDERGVHGESQAPAPTARSANADPNGTDSTTEPGGSPKENGDTAKLGSPEEIGDTDDPGSREDMGEADDLGSPEEIGDTDDLGSSASPRDTSSSDQLHRDDHKMSATKPSAPSLRESGVAHPSLSDEKKEYYSNLIDKSILKADLDNVTRKDIWKELVEACGKDICNHKKEIKTLIKDRFNTIYQGIIPLTDDEQDNTLKRKSTSISSVTLATQKRKRVARGKWPNSSSPAKKRRRPDHEAESSQSTRRARIVHLRPEEMTVIQGDTRPVYRRDKNTNAWKGTSGLLVYRGLSTDDMDSVVQVKVRPIGDKEPFYLCPEDGKHGETVFTGFDVKGELIATARAVVKDMVCDPSGTYVGFVF